MLKHPFEICSILASILIIPIWILDTSVLETLWMMGQEWLPEHTLDWVIPEKIHPAPKEGISAVLNLLCCILLQLLMRETYNY